MVVDDGDTSRIRGDAHVRAAHVQRRVCRAILPHAVNSAAVARSSKTGGVAGRCVLGREALSEVLVKVSRLGVVAARIEQRHAGVVAQMLDHQLSSVRVDAPVERVRAKTGHARY